MAKVSMAKGKLGSLARKDTPRTRVSGTEREGGEPQGTEGLPPQGHWPRGRACREGPGEPGGNAPSAMGSRPMHPSCSGQQGNWGSRIKRPRGRTATGVAEDSTPGPQLLAAGSEVGARIWGWTGDRAGWGRGGGEEAGWG